MKNVLIVDDDKLVRKGLLSAMPWHDFDMRVIGEAGNGQKALEFLELHQVDLMLADITMPVMSGIELLRITRKIYPSLAVVLLTMHRDFEFVQEALRLGAVDYIAKVELEKEKFEEVLSRIKTQIQERNHSELPVQDPQQVMDSEQMAKLAEKWTSTDWLYNDEYFDKLFQELKDCQMSEASVISLLYLVVTEWNRYLSPTRVGKIELKTSFNSWTSIEQWLREKRNNIIQTLAKANFSHEIVECILNAVIIMRTEMDRQLYAAEIAKRLNLSRSYFNLCFKELIGDPFNEYLRKIRIEQAKEHLRYTNQTILWIAENTGYRDEKYFSRIFREHTGILPSEYRVQHRQPHEEVSK